MTRDYFKVLTDARLKLDKDTGPAMQCIVREDSRGNPQTCRISTHAHKEQSDSENTEARGKVQRTLVDRTAERGYVGSLHYGLVHKAVSIQEALKIPEAKAAVDKRQFYRGMSRS